MFEIIQTFVLMLHLGTSQPVEINGYASIEACIEDGRGVIEAISNCTTKKIECKAVCSETPVQEKGPNQTRVVF